MTKKLMRTVAFGTAILLSAVLSEATALGADGDAELGEKVFRKCKACHEIGKDAKAKVGPALNGIIGIPAGTQESFEGKYSNAMIEAGENGLIWSEETLDTYLEKPKDLVDGTKMSFPGLKKEQDRSNVIAYLKQFDSDE
jgi:cytochrome c2